MELAYSGTHVSCVGGSGKTCEIVKNESQMFFGLFQNGHFYFQFDTESPQTPPRKPPCITLPALTVKENKMTAQEIRIGETLW